MDDEPASARHGASRHRRLGWCWVPVAVLLAASGWDAFLTPEAREKLDELNRLVWEEQSDLGWSYFFARSLFEIGRPTSEAPLVGFYHPWSDVWLITEWQVKPEPKIRHMELLCGEWVRRRGECAMAPRRRSAARMESVEASDLKGHTQTGQR